VFIRVIRGQKIPTVLFQSMKIKFFTKPAPRRPLRFTLLALHASGVIRVFRCHSFFRLWEPLRQNFDADQDFVS
jgi:hypothetical protein